jgi:ribonucleoside-diphosphate reductase, adenosylcobalamin-dependent
MKLSENALTVLKKRYFTRDGEGKTTEDAEGLFRRVAGAIAAEDKKYGGDVKALAETFYDLMTELDFLPNSPTLMNAGKPLGQLSACFVLPVADSMEEIFDAVKNAALIHKSGGGTGFSFSRLRASGSAVKSTGGTASGPVSFMKVFNAATEAVKQGGTRRGANMGILRVDHPDIFQFIDCKKNNADINNFNISVGITEKFMEAVKKDEEYDLIDPHTKKPAGRLKAKEVYDKIVDAAWASGEPGIVFLDRLNKFNVTPSLGEIESTNPCGEQPLLPYESCNLGSINLSNMVSDGKLDFEKLKKTVRLAVHFLDNVIDANKYPLEIIDETTKKTRKIGLGVMGFADMLLKLGIAYDSDEGRETAERVMSFIEAEGRDASADLAKSRGAFPLFKESTLAGGRTQRNATVTTIAPTGTLSMIAACSSGIEPIFAYSYIKNVMDGAELVEANAILKDELEKRGLLSDALMRKIAAEGTLAHIKEIPADIKEIFVSAHDISPEAHIGIQAAFQKYTDNAVSKTVNFKKEATREDVDSVYRLAYESGCKGVTIYRDGSRSSQVLNIGKVNREPKAEKEGDAVDKFRPRPRPDIVSGFTEKVRVGCGNLYITVNFDEKGIVEVFTNTGKGGGCPSQSEATSRLVSVSLRSGVDTATIIEQLKGIRCVSTIRQHDLKCKSCPDAIAGVIEKVLKMQNNFGVKIPEKKAEETGGNGKCPECGAKLKHEGGCYVCSACGYSKCG